MGGGGTDGQPKMATCWVAFSRAICRVLPGQPLTATEPPRTTSGESVGPEPAVRSFQPAGSVSANMRGAEMTDTYLYAVDARFIPILVLFGLRAKTDGVKVEQDGQFSATFGWFHLATPISNVEGAHVTSD
jgi:hypothetical protein